MELIVMSGVRAFPPRLARQLMFNPVLHLGAAVEIARDCNTKDAENGSVGCLTEFSVDTEDLTRF